MDREIILPVLNWKGSFNYRHIEPLELNYRHSEYHGFSWLVDSYDFNKKDTREFDLEGIIKGIIDHTLKETRVVSTPERVQGIYDNIAKRYKENHYDV